MLQDVDPVCDRERGCQWKQDHQLRCGNAEEEEISQSSPKHVRHRTVREQIYLPDTLCGFELDPNCDCTGPGVLLIGFQTLGFNRSERIINLVPEPGANARRDAAQ